MLSLTIVICLYYRPLVEFSALCLAAGQGRAGQGRAGQGRARQGRAGQGRQKKCSSRLNQCL